MKKIISIVLSIVLMVTSLSAITVATASSKPIFALESKEVDAGETVELNLTLSNNPGIAGLAISLKYDENVFTLTETRDGKMFSGFTAGKNFIWDESENVTENGTLATFVFNVSENAKSADYNIDIIVRSCVNIDLEDVDCNVSSGNIKVNAKPVLASGVSLNKDTLSLMTGESETLVAKVEPEGATNKSLLWESSNPAVAKVDDNGKVTAIKKGESVITVKTVDGGFTDNCTVSVDCSHTSTTVVPAVASTCIEHGHNEYTVCNDCGAIVTGSDAELPLSAHDYVESAEEKYLASTATCVDKAVYYKSCSVCGEKGTDTFQYGEIDLTNHIGETYLVGQKNATCSAEGYTGDKYCSGCNNLIEQGEVISKTAHIPSNNWEQTKAPTCTEPGTEVEKCLVCAKVIDERTIPATGHTFGEWKQTKAPTCTEQGEEIRECACGETETRLVSAKGHTLGEWKITLSPTCTDKGEKKAVCQDCKTEFVEEIPATGHTAGEWTIIKDAACTTDGERKTICTVCGKEYIEVVTAKGHQFGEWAVVKEATETEEGIKEHVCNICGEKETQIIPILTTENNNEKTTVESTDSSASNIVSNTNKKSPNTGSETELIIASSVSSALIIAALLVSIKKKKKLHN